MLPSSTSTSRPNTEETAAYSVSQPLYDVIRGSISRLEEQKVLLTEAKDIVQRIHVKIPQEHVSNNGTFPTNYRDSLISAWKSTTESYARIFESLCSITGPEESAGKLPEDSYVGFQKLLFTSEAARVVAFEQDEAITQAKRKAESSSESDSDAPKITTPNKKAKQTPVEVASAKRGATTDPSPIQIAPRPQKKQRTATIGDVDMEADKPAERPSNRPNEQPSAITTVHLKPKQIRKQRKQRIQQHREQQEQQQAGTQPSVVNGTPQEHNVGSHPEAQYEDVSVELEKRLKIKEEQKKAKKEAKKRKRDSQGSHILEAEPGAEKEAVDIRAKALAQKPAKKRTKSENGEGVRADGKNVPQKGAAKGKRANDEAEQAAGDGAAARRSKRNKTQ